MKSRKDRVVKIVRCLVRLCQVADDVYIATPAKQANDQDAIPIPNSCRRVLPLALQLDRVAMG